MQKIDVDGLMFEFPDEWKVSKYDDWAFYRKQFGSSYREYKALDLFAVAPDRTLWLIEAKDFRQHRRTKNVSLWEEMAQKVRILVKVYHPFCSKVYHYPWADLV